MKQNFGGDEVDKADIVEVVRCKDCKYCKKIFGDNFCYVRHYISEFFVFENDFCSRGERKEYSLGRTKR